jgi:hydrogenase-1 operon protein HyaF
MNKLKRISIPIKNQLPATTGNTTSLLHEIRHALSKLLTSSQETIIDLQNLPLTSAEQDQLRESLGEGEVKAYLNTLGKSTVIETGISGVWYITHFNSNEQPIGKFIEITFIPSILKSQPEDIQLGLEQLTNQLTSVNKE